VGSLSVPHWPTLKRPARRRDNSHDVSRRQATQEERRLPLDAGGSRVSSYITFEGTRAYLRDQPDAELHLLPTGHFALEEELERIAALIRAFYAAKVHHAGAGRLIGANERAA
jgi:hypothetical protein